MAHYWAVTVEGSWAAARAADGAQPQIQQCQGMKRSPGIVLVSVPPSPYRSLQQGGSAGGLIKESVGSPPAVGVVGDWATDNSRRLQPARC